MATIRGFELRKVTPSSANANTESFPEGDSEDWVRGEPVYGNIGGYLAKAAATTPLILGIADDAAANSATAETDGLTKRATVIDTTQIWEGSVRYDEDGDADDQIKVTQLFNCYGIIESSTVANAWVIDLSNVTQKRVRIIKLVDVAAVVYGRVQFKFLSSCMQAQVAG